MSRHQKEGLYKNPKSPFLYCRFYDRNGKLVRLSTSEKDTQSALEKYHLLRKEHGVPERPHPTSPTFVSIINLYHEVRGQYRKDTCGYLYARKHIEEFWINSNWVDIEEGEKGIDEYIQKRKLEKGKPGTINKEIGVISAAANVAIKKKIKIINYASGKKLKEPDYQYYLLTEDQAHNLVRVCTPNPKLQDFVRLSLSTAMRLSEIMGIRLSDIDIANRIINLPKTKSGRPHRVPINETALKAINNRINYIENLEIDTHFLFCHKNGDRIKNFYKVFRRYCEKADIPITNLKAGIKGFRQHDQRHAAASWLAQKGEPLIKIQALLNHSSITQTERYSHLQPDAIASTAKRLPKL